MDGLNHATIHKLELDVTKDESAQAVVHKVIEREGQIDILVNNAGMSNSGTLRALLPVSKGLTPTTGPIIDIPMQEIIQTYDTNVFSIIRMAKAVIPYMAKCRRGTIVNIGSIGGEMCEFIIDRMTVLSDLRRVQPRSMERNLLIDKSRRALYH